jgi:hypothetical protein
MVLSFQVVTKPTGGFSMNAFYQHHKDNISFHYRCFDRVILNACIQPFQQPERVVGFFSTYRNVYPVTRNYLRDIAGQYHNWVTNRSLAWDAPILECPEDRRDLFMDPYFKRVRPDQIVGIIKAREPARILISIGSKTTGGCHLELKNRWVNQYNFYFNDVKFGRMFVRICPYFPFPARIYLNQHYWLANRMRERGIRFTQSANAFLRCSDPKTLQQLSDSMLPYDVIACGQKWLACLTPFFTETERKQAGCQHRLFFSQTEYCDNLLFCRRAALDALGERLLDANRTIGRPDKLSIIFGRKVSKYHSGKLQTTIEDLHLGNPVIRTYHQDGSVKQYVRDNRNLRTEATSNDITWHGINKAVDNLPKVRKALHAITENYLDIQQDILETFVDRGQLRRMSEPSITASGRRIPGLKLDHSRQLAVMQALVCFSHVAAGGSFTTKEIHPKVAETLGLSPLDYKLSSLRYEMSKLRAKGLVEKIPHSRRYRIVSEGYRLSVVYLKLFKKIYAPLTAGILKPFPDDTTLPVDRISRLDKLYLAVKTALDNLVEGVGLKAA